MLTQDVWDKIGLQIVFNDELLGVNNLAMAKRIVPFKEVYENVDAEKAN